MQPMILTPLMQIILVKGVNGQWKPMRWMGGPFMHTLPLMLPEDFRIPPPNKPIKYLGWTSFMYHGTSVGAMGNTPTWIV